MCWIEVQYDMKKKENDDHDGKVLHQSMRFTTVWVRESQMDEKGQKGIGGKERNE